jgi:hypothetical protein
LTGRRNDRADNGLVDASLIRADANRQRSARRGAGDVDWEELAITRRSVREYLETLDSHLRCRIARLVGEVFANEAVRIVGIHGRGTVKRRGAVFGPG